MKFEWKPIYGLHDQKEDEQSAGVHLCTWRSKVIGGWLITNVIQVDTQICQGLVFIPDYNHSWEME